MVMDMTQGDYGKMIVRFSIPLLISELFQQMYSIVDSIIAGQCVSLEALAAVGVTHMLVLLLTSIALGTVSYTHLDVYKRQVGNIAQWGKP